MMELSLFKVGLVAMLFFILASNLLNYIAIGTQHWAEDPVTSSNPSPHQIYKLWNECYYTSATGLTIPFNYRGKCFLEIPAALIATGTALNCLSFVLIIVAQLALCLPKFKNSFALYFVIGSELTTLLSLVFNSTGWYFVFNTQYQNIATNNTPALYLAWKFGYSFWLMTPSFGTSVIAAIIGSSILGCTCVANKQVVYSNTNKTAGNVNEQYYLEKDAQVLRL